MKIPVSVIVTVKNEEKKIQVCLAALTDFDEIIVVDSNSQDKTAAISIENGATLVNFEWNGLYPKKRQWCLDHLNLKHDWIFFVDADEIVTPELAIEIKSLFESVPPACGYFVKARYLMQGKLLKFGLQNNKLVLFDRREIEFPVVDDLDIPGMGEMEGHYQPVLKIASKSKKIGSLHHYLVHDCMDDRHAWTFRHKKYARWETGMNKKNGWPTDPKPFRDRVKNCLRNSRFRPELIFFISYVMLFGFLDGKRGLKFARSKREYYSLIQR